MRYNDADSLCRQINREERQMTKIQSILLFIAAAIMLAAAVTLTNFAQAEVTGKAIPPNDDGTCDAITFQLGGSVPFNDGYRVREYTSSGFGDTVLCITKQSDFEAINALLGDSTYTVTVFSNFFVVRNVNPGGQGTGQGLVTSGIVGGAQTTVTMVSVSVSVSVRTETSVSVSTTVRTVRVNSDGEAVAANTVVQTREKVDNKRALQYAAGGVAAFVLIHNWIITDPAKALPFHLAFNEKGGIYSGTSWRLTPQETLHFSALESLDDKRGHYKFGVQWHYQIPPPQGITETPAAALPAIYTMPNVTPKDWLSDDDGIRRGNDG